MHLAPSLVTGRRWKMKFLETEPMISSWAASSIHAIPELLNWFLRILLLRIVEECFGIPIKTLWKSLFQQPLPLTSNQLFYSLHISLFQLKPDALLHATGSFTGISPCYMNHSMMTLRLDYSKCTLRQVRCFGKTKHQQSLRIEPRAPGFTCHNTFCTNCTVHRRSWRYLMIKPGTPGLIPTNCQLSTFLYLSLRHQTYLYFQLK